MSDATRERILSVGADLILRKGFNNTGIKEIVDAAGVPKGSFYFYFPSKEAFGLAVIDHYDASFAQRLGDLAVDSTLSPLLRLRAFFQRSRDRFAAQGFTQGCPLGNLAQEMGDLSPAFQARLEASMQRLTAFVAGILREAVAAGQLGDGAPEAFQVDDTALFIVAAWHGALVRMKAAKSAVPLDICQRMIFARVLRSPHVV